MRGSHWTLGSLGLLLLTGAWSCSSAPPPTPPPPPAATAAAATPPPKAEPKKAEPKKAEPKKTLQPTWPTMADMARPAAPKDLAKIAKLLAEKNWSGAQTELDANVQTFRRKGTLDVKIGAYAMLGMAQRMLEKPNDADRAYRRVISWSTQPAKAIKKETTDQAEVDKRLGVVMHGIGEAVFHLAEKKRARLATIAFPIYDDGGEPATIEKHFKKKVKHWAGRKQRAVERAENEYLKVSALKPEPGAWSVAAQSRIGAMYAAVAYECIEESVPETFRQNGDSSVKKPGPEPEAKAPPAAPAPAADAGAPAAPKPPPEQFYTWKELRQAYATAAQERCGPLMEKAREAYTKCTELAGTHSQKGPFVKSCEDWLKNAP